VHRERDTASAVGVLDLDHHRHEPHVHTVHGFENRDAKPTPAVQNLVADRRAVRQSVAAATDHQDLVRPADAEKTRERQDHQRQQHDGAESAGQDQERRIRIHAEVGIDRL